MHVLKATAEELERERAGGAGTWEEEREEEESNNKKKHLRPFKGSAFSTFIVVSWPKKVTGQIQNRCGRALLNCAFREVWKIRGHRSIYHPINLPKCLSLNFITCDICMYMLTVKLINFSAILMNNIFNLFQFLVCIFVSRFSIFI